MSSGVVVDFNRLPRTTRERIVDSLGSEPRLAPLFADRASGGVDVDPSGGPTSETVYRIMALRAFDELDDKLRKTFFRPTSKAFLAKQDE